MDGHRYSIFETETTMTDQKRKLPLPMEKLAFTIQEAATVSSLGQTSLYQAVKDGKLIIRKFGTRSVIRRDDLETFLDSLPVG
jgi:excisionase family DNA binding protein